MKIKKFEVKGYRSLRSVTLDDLGDCNTFYGPNGSGKSNILDALQTLFSVMPIAVDTAYGLEEDQRLSFREGGRLAAEFIQDEDFFARADTQSIEMAATLEDPDTRFNNASFNGRIVERLEIVIAFWRVRPGQYGLQFKRLYINSDRPGLPFSDPAIRDLLRVFVPTAFTHLGVTRTLTVSASGRLEENNAYASRMIGTIPDGEVVRTLFEAKNARESEMRERFDTVRNFMMNNLGRGPFDIFIDAKSKKLEFVEKLSEPNPLGLSALGAQETVSQLSAIDARRFHDVHVTPDRAAFAVVGVIVSGEAAAPLLVPPWGRWLWCPPAFLDGRREP